MPWTNRETKEKLARALTDAFVESTGFGGNIFSIRFDEFEEGECAVAGRLWDGRGTSPFLHIILYCPRITRTQKQSLVKKMTAAFTECIGKPAWKPVIHIAEHPYDNVGVEGQLLSDTYEECRKKKFYYGLEDNCG